MKSPLRSGQILLLCALVACGGKKDDGAKGEGPPARIAIAFGDCATSAVPFVSGPRPLPVDFVDTADAAPEPQAEPPLRTGAFASLTGKGIDDSDIYGGLGLTGTGSGSGAISGWGGGTGTRIPVNRYGIIGHGSATSGYGIGGGGHRRTGAVPTTRIGQPNAQGDLDKAIIRRYVKRNINKIQYCYEKQLLVKPGLQGTIMTQFFIAPSGNVASATASGVDPAVSSCVVDVIKSIEFPKPRGGGGVQVNYPFTFRRAGDDSEIAASPPPQAGSAAPQAEPKLPPAAPVVPVGPYVAGKTSPLVDIEAKLESCLHQQRKAYGVMVIDLTFDPKTNAVTDAKEVGVDDAGVAACVATAAKTIKRAKEGPPMQRCGLAFGDMPVADVPTIQITATDVTLNAKVVDHTKAIVADDTDTWKIAALFDALDAWLKTPSPTTVPIRGPGLVEPIDATPMKVVSRVLATTYAAGADFVLAAQQNGAWHPLRDVHRPVVPVPLGSGGSWSGMKTQAGTPGDEHVTLSVLITKDKMWIGLSRVNEFTEVPTGDWTKLGGLLHDHKMSAFFADRADLEIGADDDVPYSELVKAVETATKVGFSDWRVVPPGGLSAVPSL